MEKSIFELINLVIRNFDCVKKYQGDNTRGSATIEHIATGVVLALVIGMVSMIVPSFIFTVIPTWLFYSVFRELVIDREKNKAHPTYAVVAQIVERTAGFVVGMAINATVLCLYLIF